MELVRNFKSGVCYPTPLFSLLSLFLSIVRLIHVIDINEFLPSETLTWISQQLEMRGIDLPSVRGGDILADGSRIHVTVYLQLRDIVRAHVLSGVAPILSESIKPVGGYMAAESRDSCLREIMQDNQAYKESYEAVPIRDMQLVADFQDFENDQEWVYAAIDGIIEDKEPL